MASIPDSLARLFDPLDAVLSDPAVERVLLGEAMHVRREGTWETRPLPYPIDAFRAAVTALVPDSGALELALEDGAVLLGFKPPVVDRPILSLRRRPEAVADDAAISRRGAWDTLDVALARRLNLIVVGDEARARRAFMATVLTRSAGRAVLIDLPEVRSADPQVVRLGGAAQATLLGWSAHFSGQRVLCDAQRDGVDAALGLLASRETPVLLGAPGHRAADGIAWLSGHAAAPKAAVLLGAGVDLIVCVDGARVTAIDAVEAAPDGPTLVPLHAALPSGALTDERAHADWMACWQRVEPPTFAPASLPPESLTNALRAVRAQVEDSALPSTDVPFPSRRGDEAPPPDRALDEADPLQELLAQLGGPPAVEEEVDLDLSDDDEHEETMVQVEGVTPQNSRRTFSEILRSLDDSPTPAAMHARRGERITQVRDED